MLAPEVNHRSDRKGLAKNAWGPHSCAGWDLGRTNSFDAQLQEGRESWFPETLQISKSLTAQVPYIRRSSTIKQQLELGMEQWTVSKLGKEYIKAVFCHPAYLTYIQSTSCEMLGWMNQAEIKTARRNTNNLRYADDTSLMTESKEELKRLLMK